MASAIIMRSAGRRVTPPSPFMVKEVPVHQISEIAKTYHRKSVFSLNFSVSQLVAAWLAAGLTSSSTTRIKAWREIGQLAPRRERDWNLGTGIYLQICDLLKSNSGSVSFLLGKLHHVPPLLCTLPLCPSYSSSSSPRYPKGKSGENM